MHLFFVILLILFEPLAAVRPQGVVLRQPKCWYPANPGPCQDNVKVWGYDYLTNRCIFFYYGGCGGNPNRFYTKEECLNTCRVHRDPDRIKRSDEEEDDIEEFEEDIDDWDKWDKDEL